jgi:hypothetical protein
MRRYFGFAPGRPESIDPPALIGPGMDPAEYAQLRKSRPQPDAGKPARACPDCGYGPLRGSRKYCAVCGQARIVSPNDDYTL